MSSTGGGVNRKVFRLRRRGKETDRRTWRKQGCHPPEVACPPEVEEFIVRVHLGETLRKFIEKKTGLSIKCV
ncbi:hypothetical protein HanIR_Chr11g0509781 [Helianthus annuus]|nr:hypothetical protein HanIR_Chr11g0509781 [Helianthus annuus]